MPPKGHATPGGRAKKKPPQPVSKPLEYRFFVRIWLSDQTTWGLCTYVFAFDDIHAIRVARGQLRLGWPAIAGITEMCPATATQQRKADG